MLRISKIIDYVTLILSYMTKNMDQLRSASGQAQTLGVVQPTVSKMLKLLTHDNIVKSTRSAHAGYRVARPAKEIIIAQISDVLDVQPFGLTECLATPG